MYMYKCFGVCSFLLFVPHRGGRWGWGAGFGVLLLVRSVGVGGLCVCALAHPLHVVQVARGYKFFSPPKFSFTPEPVYLNTKRRRQSSVPLSSHYPVRSNHAALAVVSEEECNRLGSESIWFVVRLST